MITEDMRAYVRARLVALAEEVMMVSSPQPTERQLRQHALDRAVTDGMVGAVQSVLIMRGGDLPTVERMAKAVTEVADVFVDYLRGGASRPTPVEPDFDAPVEEEDFDDEEEFVEASHATDNRCHDDCHHADPDKRRCNCSAQMKIT